jgi:ornithine decarboxylase
MQPKQSNKLDPLGHRALAALDYPTPFLLIDLARVELAYKDFVHHMPTVQVHYAMKCNPDRRILRCVHSAGGRFEIASYTELEELIAVGVPAEEVIFSNPVKIPHDIEQAHTAGLYRFGFDSETELDKIAQYAPGASVYVRLMTTPANSEIMSEGKFGIDAEHAYDLMLSAQRLGLKPYGIAFHVGSQMLYPKEWQGPIAQSAALMKRLEAKGIRLQMLDIGGGFPAHHGGAIPAIAEFANVIASALKEHLPYAVSVVIEPGRALVGDAGVMVASVIGLAERDSKRWVHLDVGAFNGMMESLESQNQLLYPVHDSRGSAKKTICNLTGPSCDSQDTIMFDVELSHDIAVGDKVFLYTTGAYTTSYASRFNGFQLPTVYCVGY